MTPKLDPDDMGKGALPMEDVEGRETEGGLVRDSSLNTRAGCKVDEKTKRNAVGGNLTVGGKNMPKRREKWGHLSVAFDKRANLK